MLAPGKVLKAEKWWNDKAPPVLGLAYYLLATGARPVPLSRSLPAMSALKQDVLCDRGRRIFSVLNFDGVQSFVARNNQQTWSLLVLALWMEGHACSLPARS